MRSASDIGAGCGGRLGVFTTRTGGTGCVAVFSNLRTRRFGLGAGAYAAPLLGKVRRVETWVRRSMRMGGGTEGSSVSLLWVRRVTMLWTACQLTRRRR